MRMVPRQRVSLSVAVAVAIAALLAAQDDIVVLENCEVVKAEQ